MSGELIGKNKRAMRLFQEFTKEQIDRLVDKFGVDAMGFAEQEGENNDDQ